jgi:drug/metabolite transporter (DMT)-like permease
MGILFALLALASWGVGDFLIQRSARQFGVVTALFIISAFGGVALLPFVWGEIPALFYSANTSAMVLLIGTTMITLFAALFDFQALKIGKMSVVEPIYAFELIIAAALSAVVIHETPSIAQTIFIIAVFAGIFLVSVKDWRGLRATRLEAGVMYAFLATLAMGAITFLFGVVGRLTSPLMVNWFTSVGLAIAMVVVITRRKQWAKSWAIVSAAPRLTIGVSVLDNLAWIAFTYSTLYIPIAIATGISESYIALAAGLGIIINRERLVRHQVFGLIITIGAAIVLAILSS